MGVFVLCEWMKKTRREPARASALAGVRQAHDDNVHAAAIAQRWERLNDYPARRPAEPPAARAGNVHVPGSGRHAPPSIAKREARNWTQDAAQLGPRVWGDDDD